MTEKQKPRVWTSGDGERQVVHLSDGAGREVKVAPGAGFNAFSFRVPRGQESIAILSEAPDEAEIWPGTFKYGYPLLFPLPNRTENGRYTFEGAEHELDINWPDGHAIHGLVCNRPWKVVETGASDEKGAFVTATFDTRDFPDVMRQYPFACIATATYALRENEFSLTFEAKNVGDGNLPMGFGIHPWFPFPFTSQGQRENCVLELPCNARWELESSTRLLPTSQILPVDNTEYDFRQPRALGDVFLDVVYTDLEFNGDSHISRIKDAQSGVALTMKSSSNFREFVVYAPLDRDIICLEPYSSTTNAVNLHNDNVDAGLVILQPKQSWRGEISILVEF